MTSTIVRCKLERYKVYKPEKCFCCKTEVETHIVSHFIYRFFDINYLVLAFKCPLCNGLFFTKYIINKPYKSRRNTLMYSEIIGGHNINKEFSKEINNISPQFVLMFNDAYKAHQSGCIDIVYTGYRRAFKFLIKDYAIYLNPAQEDTIKKMKLLDCINDKIPLNKEILNNALLIGSDYPHVVRKHHKEVDISVIENAIMDTVHTIERQLSVKRNIDNSLYIANN